MLKLLRLATLFGWSFIALGLVWLLLSFGVPALIGVGLFMTFIGALLMAKVAEPKHGSPGIQPVMPTPNVPRVDQSTFEESQVPVPLMLMQEREKVHQLQMNILVYGHLAGRPSPQKG